MIRKLYSTYTDANFVHYWIIWFPSMWSQLRQKGSHDLSGNEHLCTKSTCHKWTALLNEGHHLLNFNYQQTVLKHKAYVYYPLYCNIHGY